MDLNDDARAVLREVADKAAVLKTLADELAEVASEDAALRKYWEVVNPLFEMRDLLTALYVRLVYGEEG